ncbi:MAG: glycosyltransferase family 9 protein [Candidatus Zixiibacteriota bacterium]
MIIRFSSLGDIVIATSVYNAIKKKYPESKVSFLTKSKFSPILEGLDFEEIITIKSSSFKELFKIRKKIKDEKFDYIIDLHCNQRSFIFRLFNSKNILKTDKRNIQRRLLVKSKIKDKKTSSIIDDHFSELGELGLERDVLPILKIDPDAAKFALEKDIDRDSLVIHPGAKWELKKWGLEKFRELAKMLSDRFNPVFIGDRKCSPPDDFEFPIIRDTSLDQLKGILANSGLFIGNDSGPVHIAAALGTPSIAIFGPTHPALGFAPKGIKTSVIQNNLECSPCTLHGNAKCKLNSSYQARCMLELSPDYVYRKVLEFLEG